MADLGKLWFELGIRGDVSKELQRYEQLFGNVDTILAKVNKDVDENANRALAAFNKISQARIALRKVQTEAAAEEKLKIDASIAELDKLETHLVQIYNTKLGEKGIVGDFLKKESFDAVIQSIRNYTQSMSAAQKETKTFATNTERLKGIIQNVQTKLASMRTIRSSGVLNSSDFMASVRVIGELKTALQELKNAEASGNVDSAKLANMRARVNNIMQKATQIEKQYGNAVQTNKNVVKEYANTFDTLSQKVEKSNRYMSELKNQFLSYTSLYAAENFVKSMITIGGEFEKQHIALKSMLGDAQQANEIFSQIKALAPISPFTFKDLVSYAKQLTAFNIPFEELYDTTKRLSDISAGLGVDMGRIILAYGQVRSASVLRGQELRQFTEAGIPMVQALADKLTKMNGKLVTTGEVFDYISKRKVPFEMVKEVLWDLTDESGRFYNMQMVLSDTLAGKWANLQDAWEIMLSSFANSDTLMGKTLKNMVVIVTDLVNSLKTLAPMISFGLGGALLTSGISKGISIFKQSSTAALQNQILQSKLILANQIELNVETSKQTALQREIVRTKGVVSLEDLNILQTEGRITQAQMVQMAYAKGLTKEEINRFLISKGYTEEQRKQIFNAQQLTTVTGKLKNFFATNGLMLGIAAATAAIGYFVNEYMNSSNMASEAADNAAQRYGNLKEVLDGTFKEAPSGASDLKKEINGIEEALKDVDPYLDEFKKAHETDDMKEYYKALRGELEQTTDAYKNAARFASIYKSVTAGKQWYEFWEDSTETDINQYNNKISSIKNKLLKAGGVQTEEIRGLISEMYGEQASQGSLFEILNNLIGDKQDKETAEENYNNLILAARKMKDAGKMSMAAIRTIASFFLEANSGDRSLRGRRDELENEFTNTIEKIKNIFLTEGVLTEDDVNNATDKYKQNMAQYLNVISALWEGFGIDVKDIMEKVAEKFNLGGLFNQVQKDGSNGGGGGGNDRTDTLLKQWKEDFNELKKFYSQYKKWAKDIGKDAALNRLRDSGIFATMFDKAGKPIYNIDDWRDALQKFSETIKGGSSERNKFRLEVELEGLEFDYDKNHEQIEDAGKRISEYLSDEVAKYNLYEKIFKKTGSKEFAMNAFADGRVWDDVSRGMAERLAQMLGTEVSKIDFDADSITMGKALEGVNGAFDIWKKIVEITRNNYTNSLEDAAEATSKLLTISEQIAIKEAEIEDLKNKGVFSNERILVLEKDIYNLRKKAFEQSAGYLNFYNSILSLSIEEAEQIGQAIRDNLNQELFNGTITAKQYTQEIKRINDQLKTLRNSQSDLSAFLSGGLNGLLQNKYNKAESNFSKASTDYAQAAQDMSTALRKGDLASAQMASNAMNIAKGQQAAAAASMQSFGMSMQTVAIVDKIVHGIDNTIQGMKASFDDIRGMFDALGTDTESDGWATANGVFTAMSELSKGAASAWDSLKNGNIMGVVSGAIHSITGPITAIAQMHDKKLDRAIQKSQQEVKKLENAYKDLETTITERLGGIYSSNVYDKMMANLRQQRAELQKQMQLEDDKKKTDKEKMEDYRQSIKEADDQIKSFAQDMAKSLYDIDVKSWAKQLTDAVVDAWAKGEDAAEAFHNKVREIVQDLTKNILTQKIMEQALQPVLDNIIAEMDAKSGRLDEQSIRRFADSLDLAVNSAVPTIENILNQLQAQGWDFSEKSNESSGLSKSVSGMSEDTGSLVASYLNATRADVSVIRSILESTYGAGDNSIAKAQLMQLEAIASYTSRNAEAAERIEKMFRSVTEGSNKVYVR